MGIAAHDDRLDLGQHFHEQRSERAHGVGQEQHGAKIHGVDAAGCCAHLTCGAAQHLPGRDAVGRMKRMLAIWTFGARRRAGRAIAIAPTEVPFGESDQAFFSATCRIAGAT